MNRFEEFFKNMTDEEWEHFAEYVLRDCGFISLSSPAYGPDGGKDLLVEKDNTVYLVSCKHYINSGSHVGSNDEENITDRLSEHNADGFIGFYSTGITTGLQNRLDGISKNRNYTYVIFGPHEIISIAQSMDTKILQSFGLYPNKYYDNVSEDEYCPLECFFCEKDILTDKNIPYSITGLAKRTDGTYDFIYGCKSCLHQVDLYLGCFLELEQALHLSQLHGWDNLIDNYISSDNLKLSNEFYQHRHIFNKCVRQRQLPQTDGTWYGIE